MDADHEPLFVDRSFWKDRISNIENDPDCFERIELALLYDDAPAFVELMNNLPSDLDPLEEECGLYKIWTSLCEWDSPKCAAAVVLDAQLNKYLTNSWLDYLCNPPLLRFVADSAFKTTALLLQNGFSADDRHDHYRYPWANLPSNLKDVLPIHVCLTSLRDLLLVWWQKEISAINLVFDLCCPLPMRLPLETLRIIAPNTSQVKREFFNYLNQGKMVEVGALLLVAKSSILSSSTAKGEGEFQSIAEIRDFVLNTKNDKSAEMEETLVLLDILDKIGDKLSTLLRLDFTQTPSDNYCLLRLTASLIEDAGYDGAKRINVALFNRSESFKRGFMRCWDTCDKMMRTTDKWPSWVKEAALRGFGDKWGSTSCFTHPFVAGALPYVNRVPVPPLTPRIYEFHPFVAGALPYVNRVPVPPLTPRIYEFPMPANVTGVYHLLKKTAPYAGKMKRMFRRG